MSAFRDIIAIIPARGGSRRLPRKNLMVVGGQPLIVHTLRHAAETERVGKVYVSTDDRDIAALAKTHGAEAVWRPPALAGDTASSESALLHVLDERIRAGLPDPDLLVFLQCTSPVRGVDDIDRAVETLERDGADSLFSGSDNKRHIWAVSGDGYAPLNYDHRNRRREQDMPRQYNENGSIYVLKPKVLRRENSRLGGSIAVYPMGPWREYQLDTTEDAELLDWILQRPEFAYPAPWPERVDIVVFDFDGVMTDNTVWVDQSGVEAVCCHRGDGWGIARLRDAGIPMLVLSTEENPVIAARCAKLELECIHGVADKGTVLERILAERNIDPAAVVYLGNDVNDIPCLTKVGFPVVVADAHSAVLPHARLVLKRRGGYGAVRELCDLIVERLSPSRTDAQVTVL